ncbi:MAG TPA: class I SAM-dependent methyltransferase [Bacteroidetes bacterium]|nr:class I SAM-dependent methyltransferase [Bacteroidota bacterium]
MNQFDTTSEEYHGYYEIMGEQKSVWTVPRNSPTYFQEMLRYEKVLSQLPRTPGKVVDLGCGDGYLSYLMARRGHSVLSVDIATSRLNKLRENIGGLPVQILQADIKHTGLQSGSVDAVVCSEVLEHIPGYEEVVQESYRILKPGGLFVITVPYKENLKTIICPYCHRAFHPDGHLHRFDKANLAQALEKAGFQVLKQKTFRSKLMVHLQYHLKLKYGMLLRLGDRLFSALMPEFTWYLLVVARKPQ